MSDHDPQLIQRVNEICAATDSTRADLEWDHGGERYIARYVPSSIPGLRELRVQRAYNEKVKKTGGIVFNIVFDPRDHTIKGIRIGYERTVFSLEMLGDQFNEILAILDSSAEAIMSARTGVQERLRGILKG